MKKLIVITILSLTCIGLSAQRSYSSKARLNTTILKHNNLKLILPDLVPTGSVMLKSNGKRLIKIYAKNQGKSTAKKSTIKVTYNWRVDHESFTQKKLVKYYYLKSLPAGKSTSLIFTVPDSQIYSHKTFGSKNVAVSMELDGKKIVTESNEKNNTKKVSLPIVNH